MLEKLGLLDDQALYQKYLELTAHKVALSRVLQHLDQGNSTWQIKPDAYDSQVTLVREKLSHLEREIDRLQSQHPPLYDVSARQFQEELLTIESNTYAELIQASQLSNELSPLLQDVFRDEDKSTVWIWVLNGVL